MVELELKGLRFKSPLGCFPEEKKILPTIEVDLLIKYDSKKAMESDLLEDALDYLHIYEEIKTMLAQPMNLLEHAAYKIAQTLLEKFKIIDELTIWVKKIKPALPAEIESVGVKYHTSTTRH